MAKTLEQLLSEEREIANKRDELAAEHKALRAKIEARRAEAEVQATLDGMNGAEKQALAQALQASSISSGEEFGKIGG